jgi:hypothetical protein
LSPVWHRGNPFPSNKLLTRTALHTRYKTAAIYSTVPLRLAGALPIELTGLSLPRPIVGGVDVLTIPAATLPSPDQGPVAATVKPSLVLLSGGGPKVTARDDEFMGGVGAVLDPPDPPPPPPTVEAGPLPLEPVLPVAVLPGVIGCPGYVGLRTGPVFDPVMPWAASAVGERTARVTILAKLGPDALVPLEPAFVGVVPGRGGNDGAESVVGDCLSARTLGGGLKFGCGLGRTLLAFGR